MCNVLRIIMLKLYIHKAIDRASGTKMTDKQINQTFAGYVTKHNILRQYRSTGSYFTGN